MTVASRPASLLALPGLGIMLALAFAPLLSASAVPVYRDLLVFYIPCKQFLADHLRRGEIPLWNPFVYMGTPFLASLDTSVIYPLNPLLLLPFPLGFNLFLLSNLMLAALGMYLFLRDRALSTMAALCGSLTFALGGYLVSMVNIVNHLQSAAWAPWILLCWSRVLDGRRSSFVVLVLLLAIQFLGGAPEVWVMTIVTVVAWTLYRTFRRPREARALFRLVAAVALAGFLAAFQILPTAEYVRESLRSDPIPVEDATRWSLQPISFLQLLFPHSTRISAEPQTKSFAPALEDTHPWVESIYIGLVPLCLLFAGIAAGSERVFWASLMLAATVLALGRNTPLVPALYAAAPTLLQKFRYPEKVLFLVHLAAAVLVAEGAQQILRRNRAAQGALWAAAAALFIAGGGFYLLYLARPDDLLRVVARLKGGLLPPSAYVDLAADLVVKARSVCLVLAGFIALLVLRRFGRLGDPTFASLTVALVAVDLAAAHYDLNMTARWSDLTAERPVVAPELLHDSGQRIFHYETSPSAAAVAGGKPLRGLRQLWSEYYSTQDYLEFARNLLRSFHLNTGIMHRVGMTSGGDGFVRRSAKLLLATLSDVSRDEAVSLLRLYSVGYLIGTTSLDARSIEPLDRASNSPYFTYRIRDPLPSAYLVHVIRAFSSDEKALEHLADTEFRPGLEAVVDTVPEGWRNGSETADGSADVLNRTDEWVRISVRTADPALLILNDSYFPGWQALVDGRSTEIIRTNVFVRGVALTPGDHVVEFHYRPASFRIGAEISAIALVLLALLAGAELHRSRR